MITDVRLQWMVPLRRETLIVTVYTVTTVRLNWLVHLDRFLVGAGTPDHGPKLLSAQSPYTGFTVEGPSAS